MKIQLSLLVGILAMSLSANADCKHPSNREEARLCFANQPSVPLKMFGCNIFAGSDAIANVSVVATDVNSATIRALIDNVKMDGAAPILKDDNSNTLMGPWNPVVTGAVCKEAATVGGFRAGTPVQ